MSVYQGGRRQPAVKPQPTGGGLTTNQKGLFALAAVLIGPAVLKRVYEKPKSAEVDLSAWKIVTKYDTPAIDKRDGTLHIEFCAG